LPLTPPGDSVPVWTPLVTEPTLVPSPKQIPGYAPEYSHACLNDRIDLKFGGDVKHCSLTHFKFGDRVQR